MRTIPTASDLAARQAAAPKPTSAVKTVERTDRIGSPRFLKAAEGLKNRGSDRIADYFDRAVANPFSVDGVRTPPIELATVPQYFAFTSLGKELSLAEGRTARFAALTEPLKTLLESKGFDAHFHIDVVGEESDIHSLRVTLTKKDAA